MLVDVGSRPPRRQRAQVSRLFGLSLLSRHFCPINLCILSYFNEKTPLFLFLKKSLAEVIIFQKTNYITDEGLSTREQFI